MKSLNHKSQLQGFTLIEILVALAIFGLLSIGAYTVLDAGVRSKQQTEQRLDKLASLQAAVQSIERDLQMLSLRRVRDELGDQLPLFRGESDASGQSSFMEFTRGNWRNPAGLPRSNLQHLIYRFEQGRLVRTHGIFLDRTSNSLTVDRTLLDKVISFSIQFLDPADQWQETWAMIDQKKATILPKAIKITLEVETFGQLTRLIPINMVALQNRSSSTDNSNANNDDDGAQP